MKISMDDFEKKINKECHKILGVDANSLPGLYWEDYWEEGMTVREAKLAVESFISTAIELFSSSG